jgi:hypothetical protein
MRLLSAFSVFTNFWGWLYLGKLRREFLYIALMMEAASTSETSINFYRTTRHKNPSVSFLAQSVSMYPKGIESNLGRFKVVHGFPQYLLANFRGLPIQFKLILLSTQHSSWSCSHFIQNYTASAVEAASLNRLSGYHVPPAPAVAGQAARTAATTVTARRPSVHQIWCFTTEWERCQGPGSHGWVMDGAWRPLGPFTSRFSNSVLYIASTPMTYHISRSVINCVTTDGRAPANDWRQTSLRDVTRLCGTRSSIHLRSPLLNRLKPSCNYGPRTIYFYTHGIFICSTRFIYWFRVIPRVNSYFIKQC